MKNNFIAFALLFLSAFQVVAQRNVTTVGIQIKPIFSNSFFGTGNNSVYQQNVKFDVAIHSGFSAGMVVRHGFSDLLAMESGINYVKRSYLLQINDGNFTGESRFRIVGYEIPLNLLVYIQLGEKIFMNASMGPCLDMFASDVQSQDSYFHQRSYRKSLFQPAVTGNLGWEYRTPKSGYFYLGASYHRPFSYIYLAKINYLGNTTPVEQSLAGNYLTIDLRYFFYEDPKKKSKPLNTDEE